MPQVDRLEASEVATLVERALAAPTFEAALTRWRTVFVERLDFRSATSTLRLTSPALPATACRCCRVLLEAKVSKTSTPEEGKFVGTDARHLISPLSVKVDSPRSATAGR